MPRISCAVRRPGDFPADPISTATLFTSTTFLNFNIHESSTSLCEAIRPASPLPPLKENVTTYCPLPAGHFAMGVSIPLNAQYVLGMIVTRIRVVDSSSPAHELACLDAYTTRLHPTDTGGLYGDWSILFWATIGLTAGYWVVTGIARVSAAWNRGLGRSGNVMWSSIERLGFVLASALSGEKFASSPALLRFCRFILRLTMAFLIDNTIKPHLQQGTYFCRLSGVPLSLWWQSNGHNPFVSPRSPLSGCSSDTFQTPSFQIAPGPPSHSVSGV